MCAKSLVFHTARSSGALGNGLLGTIDGAFVSMAIRRRSGLPLCCLPTLRIKHRTAPCHLCLEGALLHESSRPPHDPLEPRSPRGRVTDLHFTVSHRQPKLIAIDIQPNDDVMHLGRSGKADRLAG